MKSRYPLLLIVFMLIFSFSCKDSDEEDESSNANLLSLTISSGTLTPSFSSDVTFYSIYFASTASSITVTPTVEDSSATITVNGVSVASGQASGPIALVNGSYNITIIVTAEDGTTKTYSVTFSSAGKFKVVNQWGIGFTGENVPDGFLWITYDAMIQAEVFCNFVEDWTAYTPVYLVRFNITHVHRGDCKIKVGVQTDGGVVVEEKEFNGYLYSAGGSSYPGTAMVVDVTEFSSYFATHDVFLEVYDLNNGESYGTNSNYTGTSNTGTITYFAIERYSVYTSTTKTLAQQQGGAVSQGTSNGLSVKLIIDTNNTQPIGSPPGDSGSIVTGSKIQELFNVRQLTDKEINNLKKSVGVYDSSKNYNIIINGFGTGFIPPTKKQWDQIQKNCFTIDSIKSGVILDSLPASIDLSATNYFPPIGNQGGEGACVSWATAYYAKTFQEALEHGWDLSASTLSGLQGGTDPNQDKIFSPDFLYHQINDGTDGGSYFNDNVRVIDTVGCATWSTMPTTDADSTTWPGTAAWEEAALYRGEVSTNSQEWNVTYGYWFYVENISDVNIIRALIDNDIPVIIGIDANKYSLLDATDTWTTSNYINPSINHGNTIIGYVDN